MGRSKVLVVILALLFCSLRSFADGLPGEVCVADLRLAGELLVPEKACDLAIAPGDVAVDRGSVSVTVHNIGQKPAENFMVSLQR